MNRRSKFAVTAVRPPAVEKYLEAPLFASAFGDTDGDIFGQNLTKDVAVPVSYTHLRAHETPEHLVCRLLLEKKKSEFFSASKIRNLQIV